MPLLFLTMGKKTHHRRIMGEDGWTYRCSRCNEYKPSDEFHNDHSKPPFNLAYTCKLCRKSDTEHISEYNREGADFILERLGYDLTKTISKQFDERMKKRIDNH